MAQNLNSRHYTIDERGNLIVQPSGDIYCQNCAGVVHIVCDNCVTLMEYRVSVYVLIIILLWMTYQKSCR